MRCSHLFAAAAALSVSLAVATAGAAVPPPNAAVARANLAQIANFRLTDSYLRSGIAYQLDLAKHPCARSIKPGFLMFSEMESLPIDQIITRFNASPGVHAALAEHGLTAREAVLGGMVMFMVGVKEMGQMPGEKSLGGTSSGQLPDTPAMHANVAFYKAHWPEIRAFQQKMAVIAQQNVKANGGKLPACEMQQWRELQQQH